MKHLDKYRQATRQDIERSDEFFYLYEKPFHVERWRKNGKLKLWKRSPERFQLPVKSGLYQYSYITNENINLIYVKEA